MKPKQVLIDTCVLSYIFSPRDKKGKEKSDYYWRNIKDLVGWISIITIGEIYAWIEKEKWKDEEIKRLQTFLNNANLIKIDDDVAKIYGEILIRDKITYNDAWIVACSKSKNIKIVTDNQKDFKQYCCSFDEDWTLGQQID
ncbi:MAG TPA: type II toxin-antitoxin system VapC family toxin [Caldisericia bacterium]|nr:MAG: tRNA(fMet)-specific endonuclease VapC [bacterium ADurb.Bin132]HNY61600.1 type II toxin-antitoxin system VapC family toxin [Caldisericia bacterium]HOC79921.1 type II toxin-antitoxin system VapC family toxin [Caldisericia bacterium]HOG70601.1 type II toxin-antitoxin system VapC family toxin [Caldisericia bacterium]HPA66094.1 type II toxin-antitoxin system VapC family toxin [Caldisericia bacterium]